MSEHDTPRDDALTWAWGSNAPEKSVLNIGFMAPVSYTHLDVYKRQAAPSARAMPNR